MKHASLLVYCLASFALVGCIAGGSKGTLTATWSLKNIDGSPASCISGYETMKVSAYYWNADFDAPDPGSVPFVGLFDCAAGTGTVEVPIDGAIDSATLNGKYDVRWDETDSTGETSVATDMQSQVDRSVSVDLSRGAGSAAVTMYQDGGYGWFAWNLFGTTAKDYLSSCAGAGVDKIDIVLTEVTTMAVTHVSFPCSTSDNNATGAIGVPVDGLANVGAGIAPMLAGDYTYSATAYAGTTVVGMSTIDEDTQVKVRNHIGIDAAGTSIDLTNR